MTKKESESIHDEAGDFAVFLKPHTVKKKYANIFMSKTNENKSGFEDSPKQAKESDSTN